MSGENGDIWVGVGSCNNPLREVVEGCIVVLGSGRAEGMPNVAMMCWRFDIKVVKPVEDWGPGWSLSEGGDAVSNLMFVLV